MPFDSSPNMTELGIVNLILTNLLTPIHFNFDSPRDMIQQVNAKATKSEDELKFLRAEAAQQNGFENVPLFAVAVVCVSSALLISNV